MKEHGPESGQGDKPMKTRLIQHPARLALGALSLGVLVACGGGGGGSSLGVADGGIRGTGSSVGPVSGFGSVFVNGVQFDTEGLNPEVVSDDGISQESELDVGMILRVNGVWQDDGQGTANQLQYDDTLRGEMSVTQDWNLDTRTAQLSIYGLTVNVDSQTVIRGKNAADLTVAESNGDFVRINAWRLPSGEFRASYLRVFDGSSGTGAIPNLDNQIELEGEITDYQKELGTFRIGEMTVELMDNTDFADIERSDLDEGLLIEVEGNLIGEERLLASEIQEDDRRQYRRGDEDDIEFAGPVSEAFDSNERSFLINGLVVRVTDDTDFEDGLTEADLQPGLLIQVEGEFLDEFTVEADEIELREGESEVEGLIDVNSLDTNARNFRIGGVLVQVTSQTVIVGDDDVRLDFESLGFTATREAEVSGIERVSPDGSVFLEALKVEVEEGGGEEEFKLVGRLRAIQGTTLSILDVNIQTNLDTDFDDGSDIDSLLNLLSADKRPLTEVEYRQLVTGFLAEDVELEDD